MPDEYERLRRRIEDGLKAADELQRRLAAVEREKRKTRFKVIKGGMVGGAIWAGVEWFRDYRRTTTALAATGATVAGVMVVDLPQPPNPEPPGRSITMPSLTPTPIPRASKTSPPRTSPLRTPAVRSSTPVAAPASKSAKPTERPQSPRPTTQPKRTKKPTPILVIPTPTELVDTTLTTPAISCAVDLLGVKLCLPRGRS